MLRIFYTALFIFISLSQKAQAGFLDDAGMNSECMAHGQCSLDDIVAGFISLIRLLLGGIAAIALVFMVWGGVQWVWSGGNADKVKKGKDIFFNTVAALVLAFGSYMIVSFFINDVLQPKSEYRVASEDAANLNECRFKEMGEACNAPSQTHACSGPDNGETCMAKCQLIGIIPENKSSLDFYDWGVRCASLTENPGAFHLTNKCPGGADNVCIFYDSGAAISAADVAMHGWMSATIDGLEQLN